MNFWQRFMSGRYGADQLGAACVGAYFVVYMVSALTRLYWLRYVGLVFLALFVFRMLSRNIGKRQLENQKFLKLTFRMKTGSYERKQKAETRKKQKQDTEHKYFTCPRCGAVCRVPRGKGKITITCPKCGNEIRGKS